MDLISPGPALRFRTPKPKWGQGGFTLWHSGRLVRVDLEGLINTSAIQTQTVNAIMQRGLANFKHQYLGRLGFY